MPPSMPSRHITRLETVSVTVPETALEAYRSGAGQRLRHGRLLPRRGDRRLARGRGEAGRRAANRSLPPRLALAAGLTGLAARLERSETPAEGWLARSYAGFPEQRIGRRFAVRGTHLPPPQRARPDHAAARRRPGVRFRRARLHPRLPAGAGARGPSAAAAHPGPGHRLRHSGDRRRSAVAPAGAGDRHRAVVGAGGAGERRAERRGAPGAANPGGWLARRAGACRRAVRSGVCQHPGAAALPDGAGPGDASGAGRHRDPGGAADQPGARGCWRRTGGRDCGWSG